MMIEKIDMASCAKLGGVVFILMAAVLCIPLALFLMVLSRVDRLLPIL